ncbi:MAG: hypothetical protein AAGM22_16770 [Acidobacteriota bacterium]
MARLTGASPETPLPIKGFDHIYAALIRPGRPDFVFARYANIWRLYHDNGEVRVRSAPDRADIEIIGYLVQQHEFCRLQTGHFTALAELSGAEDVKVELINKADGSAPARWRCQWRLA